MKLILAFLLTVLLSSILFAQTNQASVVPRPRSIQYDPGSFKLDRKTKIVASHQSSQRVAELFNIYLEKLYGFHLKVTEKPQSTNAIHFATAIPTRGGLRSASLGTVSSAIAVPAIATAGSASEA